MLLSVEWIDEAQAVAQRGLLKLTEVAHRVSANEPGVRDRIHKELARGRTSRRALLQGRKPTLVDECAQLGFELLQRSLPFNDVANGVQRVAKNILAKSRFEAVAHSLGVVVSLASQPGP